MNYLAHLFLSDNTPEGMFGNLIADFIKGPDLHSFPVGVQKGILLHRQIDAFTDRHPMVQRSLTRISTNWGWFSGIIMDVFYDHLLAKDFERYSSQSLRSYVDRVHRILLELMHLVPSESRFGIQKLLETDRLASYATEEGIHETLYRLSIRIRERIPKRALNLEESLPELIQKQSELGADFHSFFPEIIDFVKTRIQQQ